MRASRPAMGFESRRPERTRRMTTTPEVMLEVSSPYRGRVTAAYIRSSLPGTALTMIREARAAGSSARLPSGLMSQGQIQRLGTGDWTSQGITKAMGRKPSGQTGAQGSAAVQDPSWSDVLHGA